MSDLSTFASALLQIFDSHRCDCADLSIASVSIGDAYTIQEMVTDQRTKRGERLAGYKVGCTSTAIRKQFGLSEPICGRILHPWLWRGDSQLRASDYCDPAIEPEFVLTMGRDLQEVPDSDDDLIRAIEYVSPGIEVHNYRFWFGSPTLQELIASNGIHAGLVVGEDKVDPRTIDWTMEGVGVFHGNHLVTSGIAAEILGGPLNSVRWLAAHLLRRGSVLRAGDLVIPGSPVELVAVKQGDSITARFASLPPVTASFL